MRGRSKDPHALEGKRRPVKQVDREIISVLGRTPAAVPHRQLRVITDPGGVGRVMLDRIEETSLRSRGHLSEIHRHIVKWPCAGQLCREKQNR